MDTDKSLWKTIYKNNWKNSLKIYNTILSKCEKINGTQTIINLHVSF